MDPVERDLVAPADRTREHVVISAGAVAGVVHRARGLQEGEAVVELAAKFGIFDPEDDLERGDSLTIVGCEQTIEVIVPDGYESFLATVAMACSGVFGGR